MVNKFSRAILPLSRLSYTLLFNSCLICNQCTKTPAKLCKECEKFVTNQNLNSLSCCVICALPFEITNISAPASLICGNCHHRRLYFDRCISATRYSAITAKLINDLKHHHRLAAVSIISEQIIASVLSHNERLNNHLTHKDHCQHSTIQERFDMIIPVPLHKKRLLQRGFNQAAEIAKPIANYFNLPICLHTCTRVSDSFSQQQLSSSERIRNLHNAFATKTCVTGKRVIIIDDVVTTASTANAVAKSLLNAGAIGCEVWCFARTPAPTQSIDI